MRATSSVPYSAVDRGILLHAGPATLTSQGTSQGAKVAPQPRLREWQWVAARRGLSGTAGCRILQLRQQSGVLKRLPKADISDMSVDCRRGDVVVAQKALQEAQVHSVFEEHEHFSGFPGEEDDILSVRPQERQQIVGSLATAATC